MDRLNFRELLRRLYGNSYFEGIHKFTRLNQSRRESKGSKSHRKKKGKQGKSNGKPTSSNRKVGGGGGGNRKASQAASRLDRLRKGVKSILDDEYDDDDGDDDSDRIESDSDYNENDDLAVVEKYYRSSRDVWQQVVTLPKHGDLIPPSGAFSRIALYCNIMHCIVVPFLNT